MPRQSDLRFTFEPLKGDAFDVVSFKLDESLSQPFKLTLELASHNAAIDFNECVDVYVTVRNNSVTNHTGIVGLLICTNPGVITGITNFGAFVQIPELQIDGLVHVTSLGNDYYRFEAGSQSLIGERSGRRYQLGDALDVVVARVDLETRRIDFQLVEEGRGNGRKK